MEPVKRLLQDRIAARIEPNKAVLIVMEFKWGNKKTNVPGVFKETYTKATFDVVSRDNYLNYI